MALLIGTMSLPAAAERIRDLVTVQGVRDNALIGYGLVVGLDGSGDQTMQTPFTTQSLSNMLSQLGITVPPGTNMQLKNVAAVMVTAKLPPFSRAGQNIDVVVSSMGNAKSLRGGTLLMTPLKGVDNQVYALAQGNVLVGGAGAAAGGSSVQVNQLAGGRISNGATIERELPTTFGSGGVLNLQLNDEDFTLAQQISDAINRQRGGGTATPLDARTIRCWCRRATALRCASGGDSKHHRQRRGDGCQSDHQLAHGFGGDEPRCDPRLLRRRRATCRWWSIGRTPSANRRRRSVAARRW